MFAFLLRAKKKIDITQATASSAFLSLALRIETGKELVSLSKCNKTQLAASPKAVIKPAYGNFGANINNFFLFYLEKQSEYP